MISQRNIRGETSVSSSGALTPAASRGVRFSILHPAPRPRIERGREREGGREGGRGGGGRGDCDRRAKRKSAGPQPGRSPPLSR